MALFTTEMKETTEYKFLKNIQELPHHTHTPFQVIKKYIYLSYFTALVGVPTGLFVYDQGDISFSVIHKEYDC
jgi:DNA-binding ferritin-like protein (Dps family)